MTLTLGTVLDHNGATATFRTWAQAVHNLILAAGWVQATDPGVTALDLTTIAMPAPPYGRTAAAIYRLNDELQAVAPIYMRVLFGSGSTSAFPAFTFGFGSGFLNGDPNGYLQDENGNVIDVYAGVAGVSGVSSSAWAVSKPGLAGVALGHMGLTANTGKLMGLMVERWRNPDGTLSSAGWSWVTFGSAGVAPANISGHFNARTRAWSTDTSYVSFMPSAAAAGGISARDATRVMAFPHDPALHLDPAGNQRNVTPPLLGLMTYFPNDLGPGVTFTAVRGGVIRTYKSLGHAAPAWGPLGASGTNNMTGAMLYE